MTAIVHCNPTIVVRSNTNTVDRRFALLDVWSGMPVMIKGAGFQPGEKITLTICREDTPFEYHPMVADSCGAFKIPTSIPTSVTVNSVVSVKALQGQIVRAAWPLDIVRAPHPKESSTK
jgi:hypothetical protein